MAETSDIVRSAWHWSADTATSDTVLPGDSLGHIFVWHRVGEPADPLPYSIGRDNLVTGLLLGSFVLSLLAFSQAGAYMVWQVKSFFRQQHTEHVTVVSETTGEFRFQLFLAFQACLLCALLTFFYVHERVGGPLVADEPWVPILIFLGCYVGYFTLRALLYGAVNWLFFEKKQNEQWMKTLLFLLAMEGVALFPVVMLVCYFDLSVETAVFCVVFVLIFVKILTFYKAFSIFFRHIAIPLQIFLYFCALEIVPFLGLAGGMMLIVDQLKFNL